jgi:cyclohexyl-isocyanide hydratase
MQNSWVKHVDWIEARVVERRKYITAAGVAAGLDGALRIVSLLRDDRVAQQIQLEIEYAPETPFSSGTPRTALSEVLQAVQESTHAIREARLATGKRMAIQLGIALHVSGQL